jgi:hypothetical protein
MPAEAVEFVYHRLLALLPVVAGYALARCTPRRLPWWTAGTWAVMGILVAAVSRLALGTGALPAYHPVFFFSVLGVTAVAVSHAMHSRGDAGDANEQHRQDG